MSKFHSTFTAPILVLAQAAFTLSGSVSAQDQPAHRWQELYKDASYHVFLDTANVEAQAGDAYLVWYQTIHATLREHDGEPWNREIIRSFLRCEPVSFKTVHITIFLDDGPPVATEGGDLEDAVDQPWNEATASVDRPAMKRACEIIRARARRGGHQVLGGYYEVGAPPLWLSDRKASDSSVDGSFTRTLRGSDTLRCLALDALLERVLVGLPVRSNERLGGLLLRAYCRRSCVPAFCPTPSSRLKPAGQKRTSSPGDRDRGQNRNAVL